MPKPPEKKTREALAGAVPGDLKKAGRLSRTPENTPKQAEKQSCGKGDRVREMRAKGRPELPRERVLELLEYDPETGIFHHRTARGGTRAGDMAGTISPDGYRLLFIDYFQWRASRIAWLIMTGSFPPDGRLIDHRDGDRSRDAWANLRLATYAENARNRGKCSRNTSGRTGVHPINNLLWGAEIGVNGKNVKLGRFDSREAAIEARCEAEKHYFGEFARGAV